MDELCQINIDNDNDQPVIINTSLHQAASNGNLDEVRRLLQLNPAGPFGANTKDDDGWTPLHHAARYGYDEIIIELINNNADVNIKNDIGRTPIQHAVYNRHLNAVRILKANGAYVTVKDNIGFTPLHHAAYNGLIEIVKELLSINNEDQLITDHQRKVMINSISNDGRTPLYMAVGFAQQRINTIEQYQRQIMILRLLIAHGADVNIQNIRGWTPLHFAANYGNLKYYDELVSTMNDMVKILLENGADTTITNNDGKRAIDMDVSDEIRKLIESYYPLEKEPTDDL